MQARLGRFGRVRVDRARSTYEPVGITPGARNLNTAVYGFSGTVPVEIEKIVNRHLRPQLADGDLPTELPRPTVRYSLVVAFDARQDLLVTAIGGRLEDPEEVSDKAVEPFAALACCPDDPEFIGAPADRFLKVTRGVEHGVDVGIAVDVHGRERHRNRGGGNEEVLSHLLRFKRAQFVPREIVHVERRLAPARADLLPVEPPSGEDVAPEGVKIEERGGIDEARELRPVDVHAQNRIKITPVVGNLRAAQPLHPHGEIETGGTHRIGVVEFDSSLVEPNL